jgi:hypothetical protein
MISLLSFLESRLKVTEQKASEAANYMIKYK